MKESMWKQRAKGRSATAIGVAVLVVGGCGQDQAGSSEFPPLTPAGNLAACRDSAGSDEICISGGEFVMGHTPAPSDEISCGDSGCRYVTGADGYVTATPAHLVQLSPFFIDRFPVTNAAYRACMQRGQCPLDASTAPPLGGAVFGLEAEYHVTDPALDGFPVATLWNSGAAAMYCHSVGKRLPTEAEWERAARGPAAFDYPWGNDPPSCARVPCGTAGDPALWPTPAGTNASPFRWHYPVGGNPADESPEGVREMVTGVPEFVSGFNASYAEMLGPVADPAGTEQSGSDSIGRGSVDSFSSSVAYRGWSYPRPAWWREQPLFAGMRCARSDGPTVAGRDPTADVASCQPPDCFAGPQVGARALAVAGDDIVWLDTQYENTGPVGGQLMRASASASAPVPAMFAALETDYSTSIATDGASVYVGAARDTSTITKVDIQTGAATALPDAGCGMASEPGAVYLGGATLRRITGTATDVVATLGAGEFGCVVGVNATSLFYCWTDGQGSSPALRRIPKVGGTPEPLLDDCPSRVAFDDEAVYWEIPTLQRQIMRQPFGGAAVQLATSPVSVRAIAAAGGTVYWAEDTGQPAGGTIKRLSPADAQPVVLATGQRGPRAFALTGTHVYWANMGTAAWLGSSGFISWFVGDGSIRRLPR